jgi:hypothetical protein
MCIRDRISFLGDDTEEFLTLGSRFVIAAPAVLAFGIAGDLFVATYKASNSSGLASAIAIVALVLLLLFWFAIPLRIRQSQRTWMEHWRRSELPKKPNPRKLPYIVDDKLLARFNDFVRDVGVTVILTSTWRYDPAGLFSAKHWGIPFQDVLPDMPGRPRRDEVRAWLSSHPIVTRYALLDDEDDGLDGLPLFQPSARHGLSAEICAGLKRYFACETVKDMRRNALVRLGLNIKQRFRDTKGSWGLPDCSDSKLRSQRSSTVAICKNAN